VRRKFGEVVGALEKLSERQRLGIILLVGLINGLLFVFMVPPWQHYDEPGHFEYAWLIANRPGLPQAGDYDQSMRREVAASMIEHDFFAGLSYRSNLLSVQDPIWIGEAQTADQPLYYWLAALPLRLVRTTDITFQLYLARFVSLILFLVSIAAGYAAVRELTRVGNPLRWFLPLSMALLPAYADLMTSVNNDVAAAAFFSLFLWLSLRLICRGFGWLEAVGVIGIAAACVFIKGTVWWAVPLGVLALVLALLSVRRRGWAWIAVGVVAVAGFLALLVWDGAAAWYCPGAGCQVKQTSAGGTNSGRALALAYHASEDGPTRVIQSITPEVVQYLRGQEVTLGAWMWATQPGSAKVPMLVGLGVPATVNVSQAPFFFAVTLRVPEEITSLEIVLESAPQPGGAGEVYYDKVVLVRGNFAQAGTPVQREVNAAVVDWGGEQAVNLLRNRSFERMWPRINPKVAQYLEYALSPSQILASLSDLPGSAWYYQSALENLRDTFWGKFGWGHVPFVWPGAYMVLAVLTWIGALGALVSLWVKRKSLAWDVVGFAVLALLGIWAAALGRGTSSLYGNVFIPGVRYAFPVIILTLLLLWAGFQTLFGWAAHRLKTPRWPQHLAAVLLLVLFDSFALYSIVFYYDGVLTK